MAVTWGDYTAFHPGVSQPLDEVGRREARAAFDRLMAAREDRARELAALLARNGLTLTTSDPGLQELDDWFRREVEGDASTGRLLPIWYAVVNDVSLLLGDEVVRRAPSLRWTMFDRGKRDVSFQRHVLMGFSRVPNPKYNVDLDLLLATHGHRIVAGLDVEPAAFVTWVTSTVGKA